MVCTFVIVANIHRSSSCALIIETTAHVVLPHAIKALKAKGYKLVTLAECMGMEPYQNVSAPQSVSFIHFRRFPLALCVVFRAHGHVNLQSSLSQTKGSPLDQHNF